MGPGWSGPDDRGRGGPRPPRAPGDRPPGDGAPGGSPRSPLGLIGSLSTRNAVLALVAATLIGIIATLVAGDEPGLLLSLFIIVGSLVATLGVRPGAVYLFFPLPAFAFFAGAVITGKIHDSSLSSSTAGLAAGFTQWVAGIFFPMCAATILVLVIGGARWLLSRPLIGGQFAPPPDQPTQPRGPRPRPEPSRWDEQNATRSRPAPRPGNAPPRPGNAAPHPGTTWAGPDGGRPGRPVRDDRDPWNDPRPSADPRAAADRRTPSRNGPQGAPQPAFRPRPANPGPAGPGDRGQRPPAPPRPSRPPRDPWDQR